MWHGRFPRVPAWVLDGGAPARTVAGLAKMVCGAKPMGRCPLGDDEACSECAGQRVNYVDGFVVAAVAGRGTPVRGGGVGRGRAVQGGSCSRHVA